MWPDAANGSVTVSPPPSLVEGPAAEIGGIEHDPAVAAEWVAVEDRADEVGEGPERGRGPAVDVDRGRRLAARGRARPRSGGQPLVPHRLEGAEQHPERGDVVAEVSAHRRPAAVPAGPTAAAPARSVTVGLRRRPLEVGRLLVDGHRAAPQVGRGPRQLLAGVRHRARQRVGRRPDPGPVAREAGQLVHVGAVEQRGQPAQLVGVDASPTGLGPQVLGCGHGRVLTVGSPEDVRQAGGSGTAGSGPRGRSLAGSGTAGSGRQGAPPAAAER